MKNSDSFSVILKGSRYKHYVHRLLLIGMVLLVISCSDNDEPAPAAPAAPIVASVCKVKSQTTSGTGNESPTVSYTYNFAFTYTYDADGNQVGINSTYNYIYSDGKTAVSTIAEKRVFDKDGFVLSKTSQYSSTNKDGTVSNSSNDYVYTYENERLSKESITSINNGKTTDYSFSYEYDLSGKLTKYISTYDNSYAKFEWNDRVELQKHFFHRAR